MAGNAPVLPCRGLGCAATDRRVCSNESAAATFPAEYPPNPPNTQAASRQLSSQVPRARPPPASPLLTTTAHLYDQSPVPSSLGSSISLDKSGGLVSTPPLSTTDEEGPRAPVHTAAGTVDPTPRHSQAYLQALDIINRHRRRHELSSIEPSSSESA